MVKMAKRPFEELIELLERELDERLRVVLRIDPAGIERLFARNDLAFRSDEELAASFVTVFPGAGAPSDLLSGGTCTPDSLLWFTEETVALLLYRHQHDTVAIKFDREPADALESFVERCLTAVR